MYVRGKCSRQKHNRHTFWKKAFVLYNMRSAVCYGWVGLLPVIECVVIAATQFLHWRKKVEKIVSHANLRLTFVTPCQPVKQCLYKSLPFLVVPVTVYWKWPVSMSLSNQNTLRYSWCFPTTAVALSIARAQRQISFTRVYYAVLILSYNCRCFQFYF